MVGQNNKSLTILTIALLLVYASGLDKDHSKSLDKQKKHFVSDTSEFDDTSVTIAQE